MKIRTGLGAGLAAVTITTAMAVSAPALATSPDGPWHVQLGAVGSGPSGMAVSGDGTTAYVLNSAFDEDGAHFAVAPVDLGLGTGATPLALPAVSAVGIATSGDTAAVAGQDLGGSPVLWSVSGSQLSSVPLTGPDGSAIAVTGLTSTADGFVVIGSVDNCIETWEWAPGDNAATAGNPVCTQDTRYTPLRVAAQPGTGTLYSVIASYDLEGTPTYQLWNLSAEATPVALPADLTSVSAMTVDADGAVYLAGAGSGDNSNGRIARIVMGDPSATTDRDTGLYGGASQLSLVGSELWAATWNGVAVLDPAGTTSYTMDSPAPVLGADLGAPQYFAATADAAYFAVLADSTFRDGDGNTAPGLIKVVAPSVPAPTVAMAGTNATLTWDDTTNGGTAVTTATVIANDHTVDAMQTVTVPVDTNETSAEVVVKGLVPGHLYVFAVTQSNGFFTSDFGAASGTVPFPATAKPSKVAVSGTPMVGKTLTVRNTGSWTTGAKLTYAWYAGSRKVGTAASYVPTVADAGTRIKVVVTGVATGHLASTVTSATVGPVTKPVYQVTHKPTITGKPKVGSTLTAHISGLPKGATVKYQWGVSYGQYGDAVGGPTSKATLKLTKKLRGGRISVFAIVTVPGYEDGTAGSAPTGKVK
ncbi:hypothetical protein [Krasilnikovia sp. MM14-A1004]|uniref:hypothetical protein n=1 Tax=Krasilnikovia sp. MM14-A1004 TaxID=3373541 RepID=UPI00399D14A0